jgi:hypothetical protein
MDESKEEFQELVAFLKDPKKFTRLGGKLPKGASMVPLLLRVLSFLLSLFLYLFHFHYT